MTELNDDIREDENEPALEAGEDGAADAEDRGALSPKQQRALEALLTRPTMKEAAAAAGVSETTLWRYMKDPAFSGELREARRLAYDHTIARLQRDSGDAVTVLRGLMMKEDAPAAARVSAARTLLDYADRFAEVDDLRGRLEELEDYLRAKDEEAVLAAARGEEDGT